ncbi:MAG: hypothetical protein R3E95_05905 [Thiolinea sp.]
MKKYIAKRLLFSILVFSSLVTFTLTLIQLLYDVQIGDKQPETESDETINFVMPSLLQSTWLMDQPMQKTHSTVPCCKTVYWLCRPTEGRRTSFSPA